MLRAYIPILLVIGFVIANAVMMIALLTFLSNYRPTPVKNAPYESGIPVLGDARERFSVKFYLIAMLFIIFDIEAAYLFPWAVSVFSAGWAAWFAMMIFLVELALGFAYAWKKGALEWE